MDWPVDSKKHVTNIDLTASWAAQTEPNALSDPGSVIQVQAIALRRNQGDRSMTLKLTILLLTHLSLELVTNVRCFV